MSPPASDSFFSRPGDDTQAAWRWRCHDSTGQPLAPARADHGFPTQADAESWLGEEWRALVEDGVEQVTLLEGDREVYGPMSLRA